MTLLAWLPLSVTAQAPGWGWVKLPSDNAYSAFGENSTAGVGRDDAGNVYLAGGYKGTPTFGTTPATNLGGSEAYLAKYTAAGNLLWMKALHGTAADAVTKIAVLPNGRCLLSGYFGTGPTGGNLSFAEFGSSLVLPGPQQLGLLASPSGPTGQPSYYGMPFLMAVEPDGTLGWAISPSLTNDVDSQELAYDAQGNSYLAATSKYGLKINGTVYPAIGSRDAVLLKYSASGQMQWVRQVGTATRTAGSNKVKIDSSGNVYWMISHEAGFTLGPLTVPYGGGSTLIKLSPTNQVRWAKNSLVLLNGQPVYLEMPGFDQTGALYLSFISPGSTTLTFDGPGSPLTAPGNSQAATYTSYVVKCDTAAQISWVKPLNGAISPLGTYPGLGRVQYLFPSASGFTAVTYTVENGQSTFIGSPITYSAADGGLVCVLRYNSNTDQVEWVRTGGTSYGVISNNSRAGTNAKGAVQDLTGNVYVAGEYYGPAQFGANTLGLTNGQYNTYLAKLDQTVLAAKAATAGKAWRVYPNPATSAVQFDGLPAHTTVRVLDALGRQVRITQALTLGLSGLAPGLYLLQATNTAELYQPQRLLVE